MELACPAGYLQGLKIAIESGADPATILVAITPIPDTLFECSFAALLCEKPTEVTRCLSHDLQVPARAEIILEGFVLSNETAEEGSLGDHSY